MHAAITAGHMRSMHLAGPKIALRFPHLLFCMFVCVCVCTSIIMLVHCFHATILWSTWQLLWWSTGVATMSSLAQLRVSDTEKQRQQMWQHEADQEWKCQKWAATHDAYRAANWLRMTGRRALEWNVWRPGSFLDMKYQTFYTFKQSCSVGLLPIRWWSYYLGMVYYHHVLEYHNIQQLPTRYIAVSSYRAV